MKMPSFRNGSSYRRRNALIPSGAFVMTAALFLAALFIAILHFFAPDFLTTLATPVWRASSGIASGVHTLTAPFANSADLLHARDQLVEENLALNESNRILRGQVDDLTRLLGGRTEALNAIPAGVLARPPVSPYDTLVVDTGAQRGVRVGAMAYGPGGVPLGTVETVSDATAHITLFSAGGRVTEGWVGEKRVPITLTGRGAGAFAATLPHDSGIAVNDIVYIPGPGALPVGTVVRIDTDPSSPTDTVHIAPYVNLFSLTWIQIAH